MGGKRNGRGGGWLIVRAGKRVARGSEFRRVVHRVQHAQLWNNKTGNRCGLQPNGCEQVAILGLKGELCLD
eukprot:scaffold33642_cov150-Isochrysis_galbana.AAC.1